MKRKINAERVYKISDYNTLRLGDSIEEIPDKLALNQNIIEKLVELIFLNLEINWRKYNELLKELYSYNNDELLSIFEQKKLNLLDEIKQILGEQ